MPAESNPPPENSNASSSEQPGSEQPGDASAAEGARAIRPHGLERSRELARAAAQVALDNRGGDVVVLDVSRQTAIFDFFVLATGTSRRQLHAISEEIDDVLQKRMGERRLSIEGFEESRWIVLDYGSVVIHLFDDEMRGYYDLESLWADARPLSHAELGLIDPVQRRSAGDADRPAED